MRKETRSEIDKLDDEMLRLTVQNMAETRNISKYLETNERIYAMQVKRRGLQCPSIPIVVPTVTTQK